MVRLAGSEVAEVEVEEEEGVMDVLASLDPVQRASAAAFVLLQGFTLAKNVCRRRASIVGTGGTTVLPLLMLWLVFVLRIPFRFTGVYGVEAIGVLLAVAGVFMERWAAGRLGGNLDDFWVARRREKTRTLVVNGPYALIRHPIYAGELLLYGGLLLVFFHPLTAALAGLYVLVILATAFHEERFLRKIFPEYGSYAKRTGMFLPRLFR